MNNNHEDQFKRTPITSEDPNSQTEPVKREGFLSFLTTDYAIDLLVVGGLSAASALCFAAGGLAPLGVALLAAAVVVAITADGEENVFEEPSRIIGALGLVAVGVGITSGLPWLAVMGGGAALAAGLFPDFIDDILTGELFGIPFPILLIALGIVLYYVIQRK